ncbi:peptide methionine sulfoxide reductase A1-like [Carica papaya]|uniref:peptide methionine sulfoxide reductase A1-like n=1 Tax=Carica papaya TaxID=3649 RepID=UPI000B8D0D5C|nr:peptide methionine sulfoxide reductase A1-like [Carica papaya]
MLHALTASASSTSPLLVASSLSKPFLSPATQNLSLSLSAAKHAATFPQNTRLFSIYSSPMNILNKLGFGFKSNSDPATMENSSIAQGPDDDVPAPGQQFAQFGAGCFWGVELTFQRVPGVTKTEVGYSQGFMHNPSYEDICSGITNHNEVVRVQYDPKECSYESLLEVFWARHDPTTLNRQGNDVGTQYRSGIYYYTPEQEKAAKESLERQQKFLNRKIITEILPAKKFYRAEEYHQQYLAKGGRFGFKQSAEKGCNDPIRCYG